MSMTMTTAPFHPPEEDFPVILEDSTSGTEHHATEKISEQPLLRELFISYGLGIYTTMCSTNFIVLPFLLKLTVGQTETINGFFLKVGAFISGFVFSIFFFSDFFNLVFVILGIYGSGIFDKSKPKL